MSGAMPISESVQISDIKKVFGYMMSERFVIPDYQRAYVWGKKEIDEMIDDILDAKNTGDYHYSFGSVLIAKTKDRSGVMKDVYYVIDGQQRLTTFFMLLMAVIEWTDNETFKKNLSKMIEAQDFYGNRISHKIIKQNGDDIDINLSLVEYMKERLIDSGFSEPELADFILDSVYMSLNIMHFRDRDSENDIFKYCLQRFINMNSKGLALIEDEVSYAKQCLKSLS